MFVVLKLNEYVWPEVVGIFETYREAKLGAIRMIELEGKIPLPSKGIGEMAPTEVRQEQIRTEAESHNSWLIQEIIS